MALWAFNCRDLLARCNVCGYAAVEEPVTIAVSALSRPPPTATFMKHSDNVSSLAAEKQCKTEAEPDLDVLAQTMGGFPNDGSDVCAWVHPSCTTPSSMHLQDRFSDLSGWANHVCVCYIARQFKCCKSLLITILIPVY
jgi:hypothetical protein